MLDGDTIAAIATAPGRGGVAVIRVSGPEAFQVAERITSAPGRKGGCPEGRTTERLTARHAQFFDSPTAHVIDDGVLLAFRAPHSYTGEDVVEFQCHGGAVTPRRVLEACLAAGARLARRGEFTQRAFLNGKLDYDQSAAVLDLIDAKTDRAADAALEGLAGRRQRELKALYRAALDLSTRVEHALDVDEGELPDGFSGEVQAAIEELAAKIGGAIRKANEGRLLRAGALVVLAGPPNAGKSSLMNALLEENRAIVSDVPGTTRDSIEEWMDLGGWPIRLVDTAGLRATEDGIEGEGVRRAEGLIARADVIVALGGLAVTDGLAGRTVPVHAKCDLARGEGLNVSAKTGEGLEDLKAAIVAKLEASVGAADAGDFSDADLAPLHEARAALSALLRSDATADLVLTGNALRQVSECLGAAVGAVYASDLLDNLFSRFCVGK